MKKLIIPTLIMSAFAGSNAVADPMNIHLQGKVIKSTSGIHWYANSRDQIAFTDTNVSTNPDASADYIINPTYAGESNSFNTGTEQTVAMMTTNMVAPNGNGMASMPFKPNIEVKVGDEKVNFSTSGVSTNDVTYQDDAGIKVAWSAGGSTMSETGIALDFQTNNKHQMVKSVLNNTTASWEKDIAMLKSFTLLDQAFGSKKADVLATTQNDYHSDWWNGSEAPVIGGSTLGYDMTKIGAAIWPNLAGSDLNYTVNRWFTVKQPKVTIPSAAFEDGKATYQATISITSTSV
ncbi:hypothetical protein [Photobacterium leiognathi]|uniref:hypothetical protein n=1 Tax=Photobacterium leiognathi TaxID=553611 RepID=UPI002734C939|nr:hypothetical protein [Photobacterium leiognathi]